MPDMYTFLGTDHGTSAVRFALISKNELSLPSGSDDVSFFEIPRRVASSMSPAEIRDETESSLGIKLKDISMAAVTYSMGDGISSLTDIRKVAGRGLERTGGAGVETGAGTKVYDLIKESGCPAYVIPGITVKSPTDPRLKVFSHQSSPEKIGILYLASLSGFRHFVLSDIGSNTVTLAVAEGRLLGGLDACIFAPGRHHGPLDLNAIRNVDEGKMTANEAFSSAGVCDSLDDPDLQDASVALFASMEILSMSLLISEKNLPWDVVISGSGGDDPRIAEMISAHLGRPVTNLGKRAAAVGCARIAEAVFSGKKDILGIPVDRS